MEKGLTWRIRNGYKKICRMYITCVYQIPGVEIGIAVEWSYTFHRLEVTTILVHSTNYPEVADLRAINTESGPESHHNGTRRRQPVSGLQYLT